MNHKIAYLRGPHANAHIVKCLCGWSHANTYLAARMRAHQHLFYFEDEPYRWNDPSRRAKMPIEIYHPLERRAS